MSIPRLLGLRHHPFRRPTIDAVLSPQGVEHEPQIIRIVFHKEDLDGTGTGFGLSRKTAPHGFSLTPQA